MDALIFSGLKQNFFFCKYATQRYLWERLSNFWFEIIKKALFDFLTWGDRHSLVIWSYSDQLCFNWTLKVIKTFPFCDNIFLFEWLQIKTSRLDYVSISLKKKYPRSSLSTFYKNPHSSRKISVIACLHSRKMFSKFLRHFPVFWLIKRKRILEI